ncbi:MAG: riboflavin biosynthesis protein RibD [Pseudomonadota bacterium]|jgi:diaminohydroxyphosphoribosylaminopyrimidine deaminase/5-amino-6-(5-phosphoribosylamino)uracil reductase
MPLTELDQLRLREALALAEQAFGRSEPNPRVGCVIGHADGRVLAVGSTQAPGSAHAEAHALQAAQAAGVDVRGATAWVTLEPCAHHGRTPPCADALVAAGLARVVVGTRDPFPQVDGRGLERLRAAGIAVELAEGELEQACREINIGFLSRVQRGRPWVRMKAAASLDGRTALPNGASQWITGEAARADGHAWRRRAGAVLTGIGTVLADDPRLDVRLVPTPRQPLRVLADTRLRTPPTARVLAPPGAVLVYTAAHGASDAAHTARAQALRAAGAQLVSLAVGHGHLLLEPMLHDLGTRGVNELHVEAGPTLNGALLREGLVDELLVYLAPLMLGEGRGMAELGTLTQLADAPRWALHDLRRLGEDVRLRLRRPER